MTEKFFQLNFTGEILPGREIEEVKKNLASILNLNEKQISELFSGNRIVVKRRADVYGFLLF